MAGERFLSRESERVYSDFPQLPSWDQVMAQKSPSDQLATIMAALEIAAQQEPIKPKHLDPIGLADWVGPPESRPLSRICLTANDEVINLGADGRLAVRNKYKRDWRRRPISLVEATYNNPPSEPLATTKPISIKAHSWEYDDQLPAPLVKAGYSEYSQPVPGLVEQSVSTHWFVPPQLLPTNPYDFIKARLTASGEITAKYSGNQLTMLAATVFGSVYSSQSELAPRLILIRRLRIELSDDEVSAAELIDRLPGIAQAATIDIKRGPDGCLVQTSQNPLARSRHC